MYPHERSLVQKFKDRPFVLMGVNADDPADLKDIVASKNLPWDSWADGSSGPIAAQWNVDSWPTIFLIDGNGIIRYIDPPPQDMDDDIEQLIGETTR